jgi:hypothetical protein
MLLNWQFHPNGHLETSLCSAAMGDLEENTSLLEKCKGESTIKTIEPFEMEIFSSCFSVDQNEQNTM